MTGGRIPPPPVVLLDANVLYSRVLRDYFLYASSEGAVEVRWSARILCEMVCHLQQRVHRFDTRAGKKLTDAMNAAFPTAEVAPDQNALQLVAALSLPDPNDQHVVAAAVATNAHYLCTNNLKDFPTCALAKVGIQPVSADTLLAKLVRDRPEPLRRAHDLTVKRHTNATDASTLRALQNAEAFKTAARMARLLNG